MDGLPIYYGVGDVEAETVGDSWLATSLARLLVQRSSVSSETDRRQRHFAKRDFMCHPIVFENDRTARGKVVDEFLITVLQ